MKQKIKCLFGFHLWNTTHGYDGHNHKGDYCLMCPKVVK